MSDQNKNTIRKYQKQAFENWREERVASRFAILYQDPAKDIANEAYKKGYLDAIANLGSTLAKYVNQELQNDSLQIIELVWSAK